jgi:hypothetical protein
MMVKVSYEVTFQRYILKLLISAIIMIEFIEELPFEVISFCYGNKDVCIRIGW